ncbi:amidase [Mesorhizobium sp. L-8-3]|nr:amidase [Mesorhizobium sp. L-8-3]
MRREQQTVTGKTERVNPLWTLTATEIAALVRGRQVSAREVASAALARLDAVNPAINAVVACRPGEVLAAADATDARIAAGGDPGPLAGVPVTIKVNIDQKGHATTNGLRANRDLVADGNSPVVDNLRVAGATILGRTNTPAFSMRWFTDNQLHGRTLNPRDASVTPGGSSGGAAAAVAAGIGPIAHGNDIGGSLRYPAYACGVHGLRPTPGRIAAFNGTAPTEPSIGAQLMSVQGPIARCMSDLRLALAAMSAPDARDPWWVPAPLGGPDFPRRAALCVRPDGLETEPEVEAALRAASARLVDDGWQVDEVDALPPLREMVSLQLILMFGGDDIRAVRSAVYREGDPGAINTIERVVSKLKDGPSLADVSSAFRLRAAALRKWLQFLETWPAVLMPVSSRPPLPQDFDLQGLHNGNLTSEAQLTQVSLPVLGLPALAVAVRDPEKIPSGVQVVASRFREDILLAAGHSITGQDTPILPVTPFDA